jgi:hypothetical protein
MEKGKFAKEKKREKDMATLVGIFENYFKKG